MSQTERIVYITQCLSENGCINKKHLCEKFEIDGRTVNRDIEYLRNRCDCDIEYDRTTSVYRSKKPVDIFSPGRYLLFYVYINGMAKSLSLLPLVAKDIAGKINKFLDHGHMQLANAIIYRFPSTESFDHAVLDELIQSYKEHFACDILYVKPGNAAEKRRIEPLRFINYDGQWYVLAFCRNSNKKRQFSLSRIREASRSASVYVSEIDDEELDEIASSGFGIMRTAFAESGPEWVTIRFSGKSSAIVAGQEWHAKQKMERENTKGGQSILLSLPVESYEEILRRVLFYGAEAEAVSPAAFRELWLRNIREMHEKFCKN